MYDASRRRSNIDYTLDSGRYEYDVFGYVFCFSSMAHMEKFERECWKRKEWLDDSLSRRFKVPIDTGMLPFLQLYQQIEGRGFRVRDLEHEYTDPNDIQLNVWWS